MFQTLSSPRVDAPFHQPAAERLLRIAYLTTEYPKVSHTFIRREIVELERRGHSVVRLSIRPTAGKLVDDADRREFAKTLACLSASKWRLLADAALRVATHPGRSIAALHTALRLNSRSDRGLLRHLAYFVEAAHLARKLKQQNITHVHVHFGTNAAAVALLMKKLAGITYSMTVHGPGEFDAPIGLSLAEKVAEAEFTAAISNFGKAQLCRWAAPEHWSRIHVVHCTVNPEFFVAAPPFDEDEDRFVCVGRLTPQKGQLLLLEAFAKMLRNGIAGRLVFAGDGELRSAIETRARELHIESRVEITGWLSEREVREQIRAARALVLPSAAEGLPVVLMEALALGRAVVSTFTAGIPELVQDGVSGWLVPAGDVDALAEALSEVAAASPNELAEMGRHGRTQVQRNHNSQTEGDKLVALFNEYV